MESWCFKPYYSKHTYKRGTKAKVRDKAGNAQVCMSEPNQFHHHGAFPPLIRFCEGGYGTTDSSNINRQSSPFHMKLTANRPTSRRRISCVALKKLQSLKIISFHTGPTLFKNWGGGRDLPTTPQAPERRRLIIAGSRPTTETTNYRRTNAIALMFYT